MALKAMISASLKQFDFRLMLGRSNSVDQRRVGSKLNLEGSGSNSNGPQSGVGGRPK